MKIGLLSWESLHSIPVGGVGTHVTELGAALERRGHEVHVFTRMGHGQRPYERIHGVHYHRCPFESNSSFVDEIGNMCRSFERHVIAAEDFGGAFDVVHAHDWLVAGALISIQRGRGRRAILTIHSTEFGRCGNHFHEGQSALIRSQEKAGADCADQVITVSGALKQEVQSMYHVPDWKISTIYNGVNVANYDGWIEPAEVKRRYAIGPVDPTVLFVGRLVQQKGPDLLIETIPSILKYYPRAKFLFAGEGDLRKPVESRARQLGVAHATRFVGFQTNGALANLYKACDVVCVPSRNEPFGIVILEAWSAGKPVVCTRNGGPEEFVCHNVTGIKVHANPDSIAWGLGTLFTDFEWGRWMGRNGRVAAETVFTWDAIADQTLAVYQS
jgi:glycosyltransferase involved in cell wall biosynthesis